MSDADRPSTAAGAWGRRGVLLGGPTRSTVAPLSHTIVAPSYGRRDSLLRRLLALGDCAGVSIGLAAALVLSAYGDTAERVGLGLVALPVWVLLFRAYGLYDRDFKRVSHSSIDDLPALFHAFLTGTVLFWVYFKALPVEQLILSETLSFAVAGATAVFATRAATRRLTARLLGPERVLMVGGGKTSALLAGKMRAHPEYDLEPVGIVCSSESSPSTLALPVLGHLEDLDLPSLVAAHRVERVTVSHVELDEEEMLDLVRTCKQLALKVSVLPQLFDAMGPSLEVDDVEGVTLLGINPPVLARSSRLLKRGLDVALSALLLVALAPVMALVAAAIRATSPGPVFFRQRRIGRGGQPFELLKFRTMVRDAEERRAALLVLSQDPDWLKLDSDPRITSIGRVLRLSSVDELPQLWNVLRGEMSIVGPRPLIEAEDNRIAGWHRSRLDLTPGITGLWQVLGRTAIPFEEMVKLDYLYVTNWSLWTDLRLIMRTLPAVLRRSGAN